jgi:hypothetical protein
MPRKSAYWQRGQSGIWLPTVCAGLATSALLGACSSSSSDGSDPNPNLNADPSLGARAGIAGSAGSGTGGTVVIGAGGSSTQVVPTEPTIVSCRDNASCKHFPGDALLKPIFRRILYSWTTPEQVAELRANRVLFTRTERPGKGPGYAFTALADFEKLGETAAHLLARKVLNRSRRRAMHGMRLGLRGSVGPVKTTAISSFVSS